MHRWQRRDARARYPPLLLLLLLSSRWPCPWRCCVSDCRRSGSGVLWWPRGRAERTSSETRWGAHCGITGDYSRDGTRMARSGAATCRSTAVLLHIAARHAAPLCLAVLEAPSEARAKLCSAHCQHATTRINRTGATRRSKCLRITSTQRQIYAVSAMSYSSARWCGNVRMTNRWPEQPKLAWWTPSAVDTASMLPKVRAQEQMYNVYCR